MSPPDVHASLSEILHFTYAPYPIPLIIEITQIGWNSKGSRWENGFTDRCRRTGDEVDGRRSSVGVGVFPEAFSFPVGEDDRGFGVPV